MKSVFADRVKRFSLDVDEETGRMFVSIPVRNTMTEYDEWYEIDKETFERYKGDPTLAHDFVAQAKRRELDHLLLFKPGTDRGVAD
jgi:predicted N-acyltransferase